MTEWEQRLARRMYGVVSALDIYQAAKGKCAVCGKKIPRDVDWPDPQALVVHHSEAGLVAAHQTCNSQAERLQRSAASSPAMRSSTPSGDRRSFLWRTSQPTYDAVRTYAGDLNVSMNTLIGNAVMHYVSDPSGLQADIQRTREEQDEAIRKLSGG